jgi:hypothetical protein
VFWAWLRGYQMLEWIVHALVLAAVVFWIPFAAFNGQWDNE